MSSVCWARNPEIVRSIAVVLSRERVREPGLNQRKLYIEAEAVQSLVLSLSLSLSFSLSLSRSLAAQASPIQTPGQLAFHAVLLWLVVPSYLLLLLFLSNQREILRLKSSQSRWHCSRITRSRDGVLREFYTTSTSTSRGHRHWHHLTQLSLHPILLDLIHSFILLSSSCLVILIIKTLNILLT